MANSAQHIEWWGIVGILIHNYIQGYQSNPAPWLNYDCIINRIEKAFINQSLLSDKSVESRTLISLNKCLWPKASDTPQLQLKVRKLAYSRLLKYSLPNWTPPTTAVQLLGLLTIWLMITLAVPWKMVKFRMTTRDQYLIRVNWKYNSKIQVEETQFSLCYLHVAVIISAIASSVSDLNCKVLNFAMSIINSMGLKEWPCAEYRKKSNNALFKQSVLNSAKRPKPAMILDWLNFNRH